MEYQKKLKVELDIKHTRPICCNWDHYISYIIKFLNTKYICVV